MVVRLPKVVVQVAAHARPLVQEHVLKNAFGFGGCNACAVLRKIA